MRIRSVSVSLLMTCFVWVGCTGGNSIDNPGAYPGALVEAVTNSSTQTKCSAKPACSVWGYILHQHQGDTLTVTTLSSLGSSATQYASAAPGEPVRGAIVRYGDEQVFGLDYSSKTFQAATVDIAVQQQQLERSQLANAVLPEIGTTVSESSPPTIEKLPGASKIQGVVVRAYIVRDPTTGTQWRLSFANDLPRPPRTLRQKVAQLQSLAPIGTSIDPDDCDGPVADQLAGRALLRSEVMTSNGWVTVIDTDAIEKARVSCASYDPPVDWASIQGSPQTNEGSGNVPSQPGLAGATPSAAPTEQTTANVIPGLGPYLHHPELHLFFWGRTFSDPTHSSAVGQLADSLTRLAAPGYANSLRANYGIFPPAIVDIHRVNDDPEANAGSTNGLGAIGGFVLTQGLTGNGPLFWWTVGGHDPLYVVFIPAAVVDQGDWDGFHFLSPNLLVTSVPWPFSLFVHEGMPFAAVKVPEASMALPFEGLLNRDVCSPVPGLCNTIRSFDKATVDASHEYVEAATDPFPFFGFSDMGKVPVWKYGEIADICENAVPWGEETRIDDTVLATYWSQEDHACVPNSLPTISILEPADNGTVSWQSGGARVFASAYETDPVDGVMTDGTSIQWSVDGSPVANGAQVEITGLSVGVHVLKAAFSDSQGLAASATVTLTVVAQVPEVSISSPSTKVIYAADQKIIFRGSAIDFSDGSLDSSLVWRVDGNFIGTGPLVEKGGFSQGLHSVSASATNSAGLTSTAFVSINVVPATGRPFVVITSPADGAQFRLAGPITFSATATAADGTPIPPSQVTWTSDVDGVLGSGNPLIAPVSGGGCGVLIEHITCTVTDSSGSTNFDTITIQVGVIC